MHAQFQNRAAKSRGVNAILLSAGRGKRLAPLTDMRPKCLVPIRGRAILDWQLRALEACGIDRVTVVTGFMAGAVKDAIGGMGRRSSVECLVNPFYSIGDNIGSVWTARDHFGDDTLLINGDTLFDPEVLRRMLDGAPDGISLATDSKAGYDSDDMKVRVTGDRVDRIGKTLEGPVDGESIGMLRFRGDGGATFIETLRDRLADPMALRLFYLSVIDDLARQGAVGAVSVDGLPWCEIDFPRDLPIAEERTAAFVLPSGPLERRDAV